MKKTVEEAAKESCLSIHNDMYQPYCVYDIKKRSCISGKTIGVDKRERAASDR